LACNPAGRRPAAVHPAEAARKDWELVVRAPEPRVPWGSPAAHQNVVAAAVHVRALTARTAALLRAKARRAAAAPVQAAKAPVGTPVARAVQAVVAVPGAALWHSPILIVLRRAAQGQAREAAVAVEVEAVVAWVAAVVRDRAAWVAAAAAAQEWAEAAAAARAATGPPVNTNGDLSVVALD